VAVAVGAMLGANLRFVIGNWAADRWGPAFPYGTLLINVTGAFVIGLFLSAIASSTGLSPLWRPFFVTGFLGGYTTFSSYTFEALSLVQAGAILRFFVYFLGSPAAGLAGVWLGSTVGAMRL